MKLLRLGLLYLVDRARRALLLVLGPVLVHAISQLLPTLSPAFRAFVALAALCVVHVGLWGPLPFGWQSGLSSGLSAIGLDVAVAVFPAGSDWWTGLWTELAVLCAAVIWWLSPGRGPAAVAACLWVGALISAAGFGAACFFAWFVLGTDPARPVLWYRPEVAAAIARHWNAGGALPWLPAWLLLAGLSFSVVIFSSVLRRPAPAVSLFTTGVRRAVSALFSLAPLALCVAFAAWVADVGFDGVLDIVESLYALAVRSVEAGASAGGVAVESAPRWVWLASGVVLALGAVFAVAVVLSLIARRAEVLCTALAARLGSAEQRLAERADLARSVHQARAARASDQRAALERRILALDEEERAVSEALERELARASDEPHPPPETVPAALEPGSELGGPSDGAPLHPSSAPATVAVEPAPPSAVAGAPAPAPPPSEPAPAAVAPHTGQLKPPAPAPDRAAAVPGGSLQPALAPQPAVASRPAVVPGSASSPASGSASDPLADADAAVVAARVVLRDAEHALAAAQSEPPTFTDPAVYERAEEEVHASLVEGETDGLSASELIALEEIEDEFGQVDDSYELDVGDSGGSVSTDAEDAEAESKDYADLVASYNASRRPDGTRLATDGTVIDPFLNLVVRRVCDVLTERVVSAERALAEAEQRRSAVAASSTGAPPDTAASSLPDPPRAAPRAPPVGSAAELVARVAATESPLLRAASAGAAAAAVGALAATERTLSADDVPLAFPPEALDAAQASPPAVASVRARPQAAAPESAPAAAPAPVATPAAPVRPTSASPPPAARSAPPVSPVPASSAQAPSWPAPDWAVRTAPSLNDSVLYWEYIAGDFSLLQTAPAPLASAQQCIGVLARAASRFDLRTLIAAPPEQREHFPHLLMLVRGGLLDPAPTFRDGAMVLARDLVRRRRAVLHALGVVSDRLIRTDDETCQRTGQLAATMVSAARASNA